MKVLVLVVAAIVLLTGVAFARPCLSDKTFVGMHDRLTPNDGRNGYESDFKLLVGSEVNVLPPKYEKALIKDKYLELDQVNVGYYVDIADDPFDTGSQMAAVTFHFNLFKKDEVIRE